MQDPDTKTGKSNGPSPTERRLARQAEALKTNLKRRKLAALAQKADETVENVWDHPPHSPKQ
jgi:hypothetical protein